eukprot:XP_008680479.1 basic proline-rich protein-like [Zea mays]
MDATVTAGLRRSLRREQLHVDGPSPTPARRGPAGTRPDAGASKRGGRQIRPGAGADAGVGAEAGLGARAVAVLGASTATAAAAVMAMDLGMRHFAAAALAPPSPPPASAHGCGPRPPPRRGLHGRRCAPARRVQARPGPGPGVRLSPLPNGAASQPRAWAPPPRARGPLRGPGGWLLRRGAASAREQARGPPPSAPLGCLVHGSAPPVLLGHGTDRRRPLSSALSSPTPLLSLPAFPCSRAQPPGTEPDAHRTRLRQDAAPSLQPGVVATPPLMSARPSPFGQPLPSPRPSCTPYSSLPAAALGLCPPPPAPSPLRPPQAPSHVPSLIARPPPNCSR